MPGSRSNLLKGQRQVPLQDFYTGVRKTVMQPDEMLVDIAFRALTANQHGTFVKLALRRAQAISVVNVAVILTGKLPHVDSAVITLGAVAPTIIHAPEAEALLDRQRTSDGRYNSPALPNWQHSLPNRSTISAVPQPTGARWCVCLTLRGLRSLRDGKEQAGMPIRTRHAAEATDRQGIGNFPRAVSTLPEKNIQTKINGIKHTFATGHHKTLLRLLREEGGLTGTKGRLR